MAKEAPSWLNMDFVENVLRKSEKDDSVRVVDIFTKPATAMGDNYTSDMYRVTANISRRRGDQDVSEKKSLIVKIAPMGESVKRDLIEKAEIFDTEMSMMGNTLKKMNDLLEPEQRLGGRIFHVQKEYPAFLVIEDLATLGFRMANRQAGLDLAHCMLAIRGLARFHGSSVAVLEKEPNQKKLYTRGIYSDQHPPELVSFFVLAVKSLAAGIRKLPDMGPKYADRIEKLKDRLYVKCCEASKFRESRFNVLNHGDFWVNNMMFQYNEEGKPIGHIFVDFQMCVYSTPAIDLLYFLNNSLNEEVFEHDKDRLLEEYLKTLTSTMKRLDCKTEPPTLEKLKEDMRENEVLAMMSTFACLPLMIVDKSEARDLNDIIQADNVADNPAYANKAYHNLLRKRLPNFDKHGLLDL